MEILKNCSMSSIKAVNKETIHELARKHLKTTYVPASVYRLQFNPDFKFTDAEALIPYLKELGVDAIYASPYFQSAPGSFHGYDVTNPNRINPEIGSEEEYSRFCDALKQAGMGQILDVVPNHMGVKGNNNRYWMDVLENGQSSIYAHFFDIDWDPEKAELKNKVLIPLLGDLYGQILENQEIQLCFTGSEFLIRYWSHELPIAPDTYPLILEHEIEALESEIGREDPDFQEYSSIITAFKNLPPRTELGAQEIFERNREKEINKQRLDTIVNRSQIRAFIDNRVEVFNGKKGEYKSFDLLDRLLNEQAYRLSYWQAASHEINYRRFFNINDLAAIRTEDKNVFELYHDLIFRLIQDGKVQGLRIDHPDGLYDPPEYFRRLQRKYLAQKVLEDLKKDSEFSCEQNEGEIQKIKSEIEEVLKEDEFRSQTPLFTVVEKILDRKEMLPEDWCVHGTVGYDYLNALNGVFVNRDSSSTIDKIYEKFIGHPIDFAQLVYDKKKFFAAFHMSSEINTLGHRLDKISEHDRHYRDFTLIDLITAIREVIACFPVYRTYITPETTSVSEKDEKYIHIAIEKAKGKHPTLSGAVFEFLRNILLLKLSAQTKDAPSYRDFILRFQQLSAPIMAKGVEDTAFYVDNRFISLNEVGGDPHHFGVSAGDFHRQNSERNKRWPASFVTTSTHDTKRSEDARMRLNVLSEIPEEWNSQIAKWARLNKKHKTLIQNTLTPKRNTEYYIYQILLSIWPNESLDNTEHQSAFVERIWTHVQKAIREAKIYTSWLNPNEEYENAVKKFVMGILSFQKTNHFLKYFLPFQKKIASLGMLNALSALVLKLGSPGVVDTYQGNEIWSYRLVDPDNRRGVDFDHRQHVLSDVKAMFSNNALRTDMIQDLMNFKEDGRIKLFLLWEGLNLRRKFKDLFLKADYIPLEVRGEKEANIIAFMRKSNDRFIIVAVTRFFANLLNFENYGSLSQEFWGGTKIFLPKEVKNQRINEIFSRRSVDILETDENIAIAASELFPQLGVAMLTNLPV